MKKVQSHGRFSPLTKDTKQLFGFKDTKQLLLGFTPSECGHCLTTEVTRWYTHRDTHKPVCYSCYQIQERICFKCGRLKSCAFYGRDEEKKICKQCYQESRKSTGTCSVCHKEVTPSKWCRNPETGKVDMCYGCKRRLENRLALEREKKH